jgi:hypothetical protein
VVALAEQAFASGDYPNDPMERTLFIEGYAHAGQWEQAAQQSRDAQKITPLMEPILCKLWERIERETSDSSERQFTLQTVRNELQCEGDR